jgi:phosphoenolpyruvate carboxykinase (ATP)
VALTNTFSLEIDGLRNTTAVHRNLPLPLLYEEAIRRGEGLLAPGGAFVVSTGEYTGRTPKDKFTVEEAENKANIWWGPVNKPFNEDKFESVYRQMMAYMQGRDIFVQDCFAGADPNYRLPVRIITQTAWHSLFARNMFIRPSDQQLAQFKPEFTIIQMPGFLAVPKQDTTNSGVFILVNFARKLVLIGGTWYAGEI